LGYISESVINALREIFGDDVMEAYKLNDRYEYLCFMDTIQQRVVHNYASADKIRVDSTIIFKYEEMKGKPFKVDEVMRSSLTKYMKPFRAGDYFFQIGFIVEDACQRIIQHTKQNLTDYETNNLVLYGDLANCKYFVTQVTKNLPYVRVLVPENVDSAILAGGVQYGFNY
jgi:hypothetical protein